MFLIPMNKKPLLSVFIAALFVISLTYVRAQQDLVTSKSLMQLPTKNLITEDQGKKYAPGQLIVKFKESKVNLKSNQGKIFARTFADNNGMQSKEIIEDSNISVLEFDPSIPVKNKLNQIKNNTDIEYAEPNYIYQLQSFNDPRLSELRWLDTIQWHQAVATFTGTINTTGSIIAIIDAGVDYTHPDLTANMRDGSSCKNDIGTTIGWCMHGYDFANNDKDPFPVQSEHGTHVAWTIAAVANNAEGILWVNPNAKIMAIRAGDQNIFLSSIIKWINFARHNGAKIINASFWDTAYSAWMYDAINSFRSAWWLFIAAAGNETSNNDSTAIYPCNYTLDNVICVAATTSTDIIASFSNYWATSVDVWAPGTSILSTSLDISTWSLIYEDFESLSTGEVPSGWTRSWWSTDNRWAYYIGTERWNVLLSDMNTPYANNIDSSIIISANTASATRIGIDFWTICDTEYTANGDYMSIEARPSGSTGWTTIGTRNEYSLDNDTNPTNNPGWMTYGNLTYDLDQSFASNEFQIRFRWRTNASDNDYNWCLIDDVSLVRYTQTQIYENKNGTSMATPHVVGLASLAWNFKPSAPYSEIRSAIINGWDVITSLSGKTVSSKRINAFTTLSLLADTTPAPFSFTHLTNQIPNSYATGNTITVSWITAGAIISVFNGEYQINSWWRTSTTGIVYNQNLVTLRIMTASWYAVTTTGILNIWWVTGALMATTQEDPAAPSCILFKDPATWTSGNVILTISWNAAVIDSGYSFNLSGAFSDTRTWVATIWGTYYAYVKNEAGTIRSCSTGVYIDKTAPVITISSHTNNQQITWSTVNLAGTATDVGCQLASLLINGVVLSTGSSWNSTVTLDWWVNAITITGTDCVGNTIAAAINLIRKNYVTNTPTYFINGTRATIGFTTDLPAQWFVRYGTSSASLTSIATWSTTGRSHSIIIDGLSTNTTYYYQAYANNDGYDWGPSSIASFFTPHIIDPSTIITELTTTGTVQLSGASSNGITFTTPGVLILVGSWQTNNKLEINFSGFVIQSNGWDGFIVPPTVLGSSDTNNATTSELWLSSTTNTILTTVQAGSTGSTLVASTANTYFKISFVVSSGTSGEKLDIYRSSNGSIRGANAPDTYCKLDANKVCTFRTDHLSYFTTVRVSSAWAGWWGWGWWGSTSWTGTCTSIQLICIDGEYEMKPWVYCEWGSLGGTCSGTGTAVEDILMTLISSIKWSWSIENSPFKTERNNAYLYAYQIGITTMPTIKKANMTWDLIRSHMAKMMVNYAINVLKKTPNTSLTCTFSDIENETEELQWYIKQACQLGIMGQGISQFYPKGKVSRAEFGTVLSRALYGNTYNTGTPYYTNHLKILKNNAIITNTDPTIREMRAYVMLMLMRASDTLD
jgi:subtilisin family serine protease